MGLRGKVLAVSVAAVISTAVAGIARAEEAPPDPKTFGEWTDPFVEPTIEGQPTEEWCLEDAEDSPSHEHDGKNVTCKPTAGSIAVLGGPDVLYWDALEDMEEVELGVAAEFGSVSVNDQSRVVTLGSPNTWSEPKNNDGGATADTHPLFGDAASDETYNDGALFCAALSFLPDGRVLAVGGTAYYQDPAITSKYGVAELEGLDNARVFDPRTRSWSPAGEMNKGRWYPTSVPFADGNVFVASGVTKLIKPLYPDQPPTESGRNVVTSEIFDPRTGAWTENPESANKSLPLFPRLHLLPGGRVYFNGAGQVFNPNGFAYDEVLWNQASVYDPGTKTWTDLGLPGMGTPAPGFRGSTFSVMLPLKPDGDGRYTKAEFLTAGGIIGTSPGTYFAVTDSRVETVDTSDPARPTIAAKSTDPLNQARWYGTGVLTPTGEVVVLSGANADEVLGPGTAVPVTIPELFDPEKGTWTQLAGAKEKRSYHNTAALLPDGRILVGGHAPISTLYANNRTLVPGVTSPQETRNPTFEIYSPPYLFRGDRPKILVAPATATPGHDVEIALDIPSSEVGSVMLMRRTAITHLVDGGQRGVELPIVSRVGKTMTVHMPDDPSVVPPGPYLLFVNRSTPDGPTPSVAWDVNVQQVAVPATTPVAVTAAAHRGAVARDLAKAGAVPVDAGLAFHEIHEISGHGHALPAGRRDDGIPWSTWPAVAGILTTGFWTLRRKWSGEVSRTGR